MGGFSQEPSIVLLNLSDTEKLDPKLRELVNGADVNQDGRVTMSDFINTLQKGADAKNSVAFMRKVVAVMVVFVLVIIGANVGLAFATARLARTVDVQNGLMVQKGTSDIIRTGQALANATLADAYTLPLSELRKTEDVVFEKFPSGNNTIDIHLKVVAVTSVQGTYALFFTDVPNTYVVVTAKGSFLEVTDTPLSITSDPTFVLNLPDNKGRRLNSINYGARGQRFIYM